MHSPGIFLLSSCVLGAALVAGCAQPPSSSVQPSAVAVIEPAGGARVQNGRVISVEDIVAIVPAPANGSSGGGAGGTTVTSGPSTVTVELTDGTQEAFSIEHPSGESFAVGDRVKIITDKDGITIVGL